MNKKQLIVLWVMVGAICFVVFTAPKYFVVENSKLAITFFNNPDRFTPLTNWDYVERYSIPVLLVGFSLILTLRTKKK